MDTLKREATEITMNSVSQLSSLQAEQRDIESKIQNIVNAVAAGLYSPAMNEAMKALESRKSEIQSQMTQLKSCVDAASLPAEKVSDLLDIMVERSSNGDSAILSVVSRVEIGKTSIKIFTMFDPDKDPKSIDTEVLEIPGDGSPAPRINITAFGFLLHVRR